MGHKNNRRLFEHEDFLPDSGMKYKDLKQLLEKEKREEHSQVIKDIIFNKVFARFVFAVCIGLNLLFITLGILNYFKIVG